jgi:outer membrane protein
MVEQWTENPCVPGSIPGGTTPIKSRFSQENRLFLCPLRKSPVFTVHLRPFIHRNIFHRSEVGNLYSNYPILFDYQSFMKNLSLILNIVLLALVGHLYYLNLKKPAAETVIAPTTEAAAGVKVAYVNADTLYEKYQWYKEQREVLQNKLEAARKSFAGKEEAFAKDYQAFMEKYQSGNFPPAELEKEGANLQARERNLMQEGQNLQKKLGDDEVKANNELLSNIETQLKALQSQIGYDYILSYTRGAGQVWFANDSLDVTKQVLELLNANHPKK